MTPSRFARRAACLGATSALLLAALACANAGSGPDAAATVEALNRIVQQTLAVQTRLPPGPPATDTPAPTPRLLPSHTPTLLPASPQQPSPAPTEPPPTATLPPEVTATALARPNGLIYHATHVLEAPAIDGLLYEWSPMPYSFSTPVYRPENWVDANDNSVGFSLAWNEQFLFLAAIVTDDMHVQTQHGEMIYRGDSLEILLDADLAGDYTTARLSADDYQLGLSPGTLNGDTPEAYLWYPASRSGAATTVQLAALPDGQGYRLEAAIPWALFDLAPAGGTRLGFALSASDDDTPDSAEQQSLISTTSTRRLLDPTSWGTLALDTP